MEILKFFKDDKQIKNSLKLDDGIYIKLNKDNTFKSVYINNLTEDSIDSKLLNWFRMRYFHSLITSSQKCMDTGKSEKYTEAQTKRVYNNNLCSFFFYEKIFYNKKMEISLKTTNDSIGLFCEKYGNNNFIRKTFKDRQDELPKESDFENYKNRLEAILPDIYQEIQEIRKEYKISDLKVGKNKVSEDLRIRIFFDLDESEYKKQGNIYKSSYLFNKNDYNKTVKSKVMGASGFSSTYNIKKRFLISEGTFFKAGLISLEDSFAYDRLMFWLKSQEKKINDKIIKIRSGYISLNNNFETLQLKDKLNEKELGVFISFSIDPQSGELTIEKYYTCMGSDEIDFKYQNFLLKNKKSLEEKNISSRFELEKMTNSLFFSGYLIYNYHKDSKDIKISDNLTQTLKQSVILSRNACFSFFKEGNENAFKNLITREGFNLVLAKGSKIKTLKEFKVLENAFNLYLNYENYFKNKESGEMSDALRMKTSYLSMSEKIIKKEKIVLENEIDFGVLIGQFVRYLLSQSKAEEVTYQSIETFLKTKSYNKVLLEWQKLLDKYKHEININNLRINNAISSILEYEPINNYNQKAFLYGFSTKNVFYLKGEKEITEIEEIIKDSEDNTTDNQETIINIKGEDK